MHSCFEKSIQCRSFRFHRLFISTQNNINNNNSVCAMSNDPVEVQCWSGNERGQYGRRRGIPLGAWSRMKPLLLPVDCNGGKPSCTILGPRSSGRRRGSRRLGTNLWISAQHIVTIEYRAASRYSYQRTESYILMLDRCGALYVIIAIL